jgi:hypothetical protein
VPGQPRACGKAGDAAADDQEVGRSRSHHSPFGPILSAACVSSLVLQANEKREGFAHKYESAPFCIRVRRRSHAGERRAAADL